MTVAIESLVFSDIHSRRRRLHKRDVQSLCDWIRAWRGPEELRLRAIGAISNLGQARAGDILLELVRKGAVTKQQYDAWKRLRNRSTHEYQLLRSNPDQLRELLPHIQVLFYRLVFHVIGYSGPYTDYSSPDWPMRRYPGNEIN
jgi:hypothetical protein